VDERTPLPEGIAGHIVDVERLALHSKGAVQVAGQSGPGIAVADDRDQFSDLVRGAIQAVAIGADSWRAGGREGGKSEDGQVALTVAECIVRMNDNISGRHHDGKSRDVGQVEGDINGARDPTGVVGYDVSRGEHMPSVGEERARAASRVAVHLDHAVESGTP